MTTEPQIERNSAEQTRLALVRAALDLFGRKGFEGSSTREIAALAEANIGSIAYHFGGKEGLRTACAEYIVSTLSAVSGQVLGSAPDPSDLSPAEAHALLKRMIETMLGFLVGQARSGDFVQFILQPLHFRKQMSGLVLLQTQLFASRVQSLLIAVSLLSHLG